MVKLMPNSEVYGLAALMVSHDARRLSRQSSTETYIPLESQNRAFWNQAAIAKANELMHQAMQYQQPGPYQIQAAISALHNQAKSWQVTDWSQILLLYASLYRLTPSPVVALNHALAKANSGQVAQAYAEILKLSDELHNYQPFYAAKATLETQMHQQQAALQSLEKAISLSKNGSERDFLKQKHAVLLKNQRN
jgi:RNA polymerase sigma-70 factor (ECF subfamily)